MTLSVELTYSVTFKADVESPLAEDAIERAKIMFRSQRDRVIDAGCELTDVHVSRRPA